MIALLILLLAPPLSPADAAEKHIARGKELRELRQDDAALTEFEAAHKLNPTPRSLTQIGLAKQALGRWVEAEATLSEALAAKTDPYIAQWSGSLEKSLAEIRTHLGELRVDGGPPGAEVWVNGRRAGLLPLAAPVRVVAGTVALEVKLAGHYPVTRNVTMPPGGLARETVELTAMAAPPVVEPPAAPSAPKYGPSPAFRRTVAYATAGASVVFLGVGVTFHILRESAVSDFNSHRECDEKLPNRGDLRVCRTLYDSYRRRSTGMLVGYVGAGLLGGLASVFFFTAPSPEGNVASACGPGPGAFGLSCGGRF